MAESAVAFRLLKPGPDIKETPCGADDLLQHYGLSGIYRGITARGTDTYLKGLPAELDFRRGKGSMELAALAMLNPLRADICPLTPYQLMPFKLQPGAVSPQLVSEEDLGQQVDLAALRVAKAGSNAPPSGSKPKKDKKDKDKKQKKDKKQGNKRKASEEPSDGTTTMTGMLSTGTSSSAVRLRIKQPRLA